MIHQSKSENDDDDELNLIKKLDWMVYLHLLRLLVLVPLPGLLRLVLLYPTYFISKHCSTTKIILHVEFYHIFLLL